MVSLVLAGWQTGAVAVEKARTLKLPAGLSQNGSDRDAPAA